MAVHRIKKGLDLPIEGQPRQEIVTGRPVRHVAIMGGDYAGMKPRMHVSPGDHVKRGQLLFEDRKMPGVRFTAPGTGKVSAINRGARRVLQSVVIELDQGEGEQEVVEFEAYTGKDIDSLTGEQIAGLLLESGLWTVIRARPFGRTAIPRTSPHSIFITAMDTSPHAPSVDVALQGREDDFLAGVRALSALTEGKTWVCRATGSNVPVPEGGNIQLEEFEGPHPAGTPGVHIHFLDPAGRDKTVWYVNYQDTAAIGHLLTTGKMDVERVISIGGPAVKNPRLLRTRLGASLNELLEDEFSPGNNRVISGSVLYGRAAWDEIHGYLGRYHLQVTALPEGGQRYFLGWLAPGFNMFSVITAYASSLLPGKKFRMTTSTNGSSRAMVPIGTYEKVMPMDIIPTYLLRALAVGDAERAEQLGCLELEEEDLALCTFVCPGKTNYGPMLREVLTEIEKEG